MNIGFVLKIHVVTCNDIINARKYMYTVSTYTVVSKDIRWIQSATRFSIQLLAYPSGQCVQYNACVVEWILLHAGKEKGITVCL